MNDKPAAAFLKQVTSAAHRETEAAANGKAIMEGRIDLAEYRQLIQANFTVWAAVETPLYRLLSNPARKPDWSPYLLGFSARLREDLALCSAAAPSPPLPPAGLDFSDEATILGALYVLNGSTLGGRYLYGALRRNEHLDELGAFHFYRACAELDPEHWAAFQRHLNDRLLETAARERAAAAARRVFTAFTHAYRNELS